MEYAWVTPKTGCIIRDPTTKEALPAGGKRVKVDLYWRRRIKDGDVTVKKENKESNLELADNNSEQGE